MKKRLETKGFPLGNRILTFTWIKSSQEYNRNNTLVFSSADGRLTDRGSNPGTGYYFATTKRNNNLTRGIPLSPPKIILRGEIQGVTKFS